MACDPREAALALHRFGFGPRAGSITAIASDPRGALGIELEDRAIGGGGARQIRIDDLPGIRPLQFGEQRATGVGRNRHDRTGPWSKAEPV